MTIGTMNKSPGEPLLKRLTRSQFEGLIPHAGRMCLIDSVEFWNADSITCLSTRYQDKSNPLRSQDGLSSLHLLEYGAQAMAIHGGLLNSLATRGMLAALRNVQLYIDTTEEITGPITIKAIAKANSSHAAVYNFQVLDTNNSVLVEASATVINQFNDSSV